MNRRILIGCALWLSLVLATVLGLWLSGSCAMAKKYRPPLVVQTGPVWIPPNPRDEDVQFFGRLSVATRPVGGWVDVRYGIGTNQVESTSAGVTIFFPGGDYWKPQTKAEETEEELLLPPDATR